LLCGVIATLGISMAISNCSGSGDRQPGEDVGRFASARGGVCQAAEAAGDGDAAGAKTIFFDRSHQPLHELAAAAQERDRGVAARLLEAKERVESGFENDSPTLAVDLETLAVASGRAMIAAGTTDPGPCRP